jgi:uncharacterized membrane protein YhhN
VSLGRWLVAAALAAAVADWVAVARGSKRAEFVLKPLPMLLLICATIAFRTDEAAVRFDFTVAALVLSLAGDVFLMVPTDLFVSGLASFLMAHIAYVVAFTVAVVGPYAVVQTSQAVYEPDRLLLPGAVAVVAVLAVAVALFVRIRRGIVSSGHAELVVPVAVYVLAISAMVVSALMTLGRPSWSVAGRTYAIGGALLFFVSDALIGWTRFVKAYRWGPVAIMATYHLGQVALVLGLLGTSAIVGQ